MKKPFYLTTTLPYVNADPHIGFALELVQADTYVRYHEILGNDIFFNTGTDEHGLKIFRKAEELGIDPQEYCDTYAAKFNDLKDSLNLSYNHFIRTTDKHHKMAAQEFWKRCKDNGDIYKKNYQIKYCVGCELEKTDSELVEGHCPLHPNLEIELINEENYFFKFSAFQDKLLEFYKQNPDFVKPESKFNEIKNFVEAGLQDFSISRLKSKMPWGVQVPDDEDHVMYVWFDALINYISTTGWPDNNEEFEKWWGTSENRNGIQVAGKDNLRQQSAMWQAMLMSAKLPNSKQIFIHGFVTADGQKMSKSLGNVVNPLELVEKWGTDSLRYYLLKEIPSLDDGDFSHSRMEEVYNTDLANELGNLVMRLTTLGEKDGLVIESNEKTIENESYKKFIESFEFNRALEEIWKDIKELNKSINDFEPWKKESTDRKDFLTEKLLKLNRVATALLPFIPETAGKIIKSTSGTINKSEPLFPRVK
jgi:methionyl-tRNA synthetase